MAEPIADVDLDALAPAPKRVKLGGKVYKMPGDMPLELLLRIQTFERRADAGEDQIEMLGEMAGELLALFQVHNPKMTKLPPIGVLTLLQSVGAIYAGRAVGEATPNRATRRQKRKTP